MKACGPFCDFPRGLAGVAWPAVAVFGLLVTLGGCQRPAAGGKDEIAGVIFQEDQFFRTVAMGMEDAARRLDVTFDLGQSRDTLDREISLIEAYEVRQVKAIVVSPISAKGSIQALKRAHDKGIKIVTFDTALDADFPVSYIESNQVELGQMTGRVAREYVQQKLGGKAKVVTIGFASIHPESGGDRLKGFVNEISQLPGVQIIAQQDAWMAPEAANLVGTILTAHDDVDIVWSANEGGTVGAVTAVKAAGRVGRVVVFGTDMSGQLADFLTAGDNVLQAVTAQKPFEIGTMAVETAVKAIRGQAVQKKITLPGVLYARGNTAEIQRFRQQLQTLPK